MSPTNSAFFELFYKDLLAVYMETRGCHWALKEALHEFWNIEKEEGEELDDDCPENAEFLSYAGLPEEFEYFEGTFRHRLYIDLEKERFKKLYWNETDEELL